MQVTGDGVTLSGDEQIISDIFGYLVEERGLTPDAAEDYLHSLSARVGPILTEALKIHALGNRPMVARHSRGVQVGDNNTQVNRF